MYTHRIKPKKTFSSRVRPKRLTITLLVILTVCGSIAGIIYSKKYQAMKVDKNIDAQTDAQKEIDMLVMAVGKLIELPNDEVPTIATVLDKDALKEQLFFAKAENDDKLLAYTKTMQAILYRPSVNKIINVAPIVISQPVTEELQNQLEE